MGNIAGSIAALLTANGIIQDIDTDKCRYGLEIFISSILELTSILLISIFMNNFLETLLFFTAFIPLRIYAGGYHADTHLRCYMVSLGVYVLFTILMRTIPIYQYEIIVYIDISISSLIVLFLSPIKHNNKTLTPQKTKTYKKISIVICAIESGILLLCLIAIGEDTTIMAFSLGLSAATLSIIAAVIKEAVKHKKESPAL